MASTSQTPIELHKPGSSHPSLLGGPGGFDAKWFMGSWGVAWSTLPMWKGKKDVIITYENPSADYTSFDSSVASRKASAAADSSPSTVRGRETMTKGGPNAATYDWQGKSYLFFVHSHWELLGYGREEETGLEWAATCKLAPMDHSLASELEVDIPVFSKTLFTPAGLDIYIRNFPSAPKPAGEDLTVRADLVRRIAAELGKVEGVSELAKGGFEVPGIV